MGIFSNVFNRDVYNKSSDQNAKNRKKNISEFPNFTTKFSEEISREINNIDLIYSYNSYYKNGIELKKETDNMLKLVYHGILANDGADQIYTIIGYGNNLMWEDEMHYQMNRIGEQTFELMLPITRNGNINIAFKDSAANWDNNSGMNYSFSQ